VSCSVSSGLVIDLLRFGAVRRGGDEERGVSYERHGVQNFYFFLALIPSLFDAPTLLSWYGGSVLFYFLPAAPLPTCSVHEPLSPIVKASSSFGQYSSLLNFD
jgi:hypothetical protein